MLPDHEFKTNFSPAEPATDATSISRANTLTLYKGESPVRNLCLVWPDGRRAFFNYAYLVAGDLSMQDMMQVILLYFSGQIVTLKGYQLGLLFDLLLNHSPKTITVSNLRYVLEKENTATIIEIIIKDG